MQHLLAAYLAQLTKLEIQTIPFRGGAPAITELLAKRIDLFIDPPITLLENIQAGQLRAIAVTSKTRFAGLPDVPTIAEAGFAGFSVMSWAGVTGPAKLPQEIVARLNAEIRAHMTEPEVMRRIRTLGSEPALGTPSDFRDMVSSDLNGGIPWLPKPRSSEFKPTKASWKYFRYWQILQKKMAGDPSRIRTCNSRSRNLPGT